MKMRLSNLLLIFLVILVGAYFKFGSVEIKKPKVEVGMNWSRFGGFEFDYMKANTLARYSNLHTEVVIPQEMEGGRQIRYIGDGAFHNIRVSVSDYPKEMLGSVVHDGEYIYSKVGKITFSEGLVGIHRDAFKENELTEIVIPEGVTFVDTGAFASNKITEIKLPESLRSLAGFEYNQLTKIEIPESVTLIGEGAFKNNKLEYLFIPDKVTDIRESAFAENRIKRMNMPDSVAYIGDSAFEDNQLTEIILPDAVEIGIKAFKGNNLEIIRLKGRAWVAENAFSDNTVKELILSDKEPMINDYAFGMFAPLIYSGSGPYHYNGQNWIKD